MKPTRQLEPPFFISIHCIAASNFNQKQSENFPSHLDNDYVMLVRSYFYMYFSSSWNLTLLLLFEANPLVQYYCKHTCKTNYW